MQWGIDMAIVSAQEAGATTTPTGEAIIIPVAILDAGLVEVSSLIGSAPTADIRAAAWEAIGEDREESMDAREAGDRRTSGAARA